MHQISTQSKSLLAKALAKILGFFRRPSMPRPMPLTWSLALLLAVSCAGPGKVELPRQNSGTLRSGADYQCLLRNQDKWPENALAYNQEGQSLCARMEAAASQEPSSSSSSDADAFFRRLKTDLPAADFGENIAANMTILYLDKQSVRPQLVHFLESSTAYVAAESADQRLTAPYPPRILFQVYSANNGINLPVMLRIYDQVMSPCRTGYSEDDRICDIDLVSFALKQAAHAVSPGVDGLLTYLYTRQDDDTEKSLWYGVKLAQSLSMVSHTLRTELAWSYFVAAGAGRAEVVNNLLPKIDYIIHGIPLTKRPGLLTSACLDFSGVLAVDDCFSQVRQDLMSVQ